MPDRLAIVTHNVIRGDGQGRVALEIARRAISEGWEVTLIADRVDPELLQAGARHVPIALGAISQKVILVKVWEFARRADAYLKGRESEFDIVLGFGFTLTRPHHISNAAFCHGAWHRCPAFKSMWSGPVQSAYQNLTTFCNARWEKIAFARAGLVAPVSERTAEELVAIGVPKEKIQVLYNGADPEEFSPAPVSRAEVGLPEDGVLAAFVGDIRTPRKGLDTVLKALVKVPDLQLAVAGEASGSPYPALAEQLGVAGRVHFVGYRKDVHKVLKAADFFVFPSRYEPFGMVALEAAFCGVPSALARTVGASEALAGAAIVIDDPDDVGALAGAMQRLTSDEALRERLGAGGLALRESLSWRAVTDQWMRLFAERKGRI